MSIRKRKILLVIAFILTFWLFVGSLRTPTLPIEEASWLDAIIEALFEQKNQPHQVRVFDGILYPVARVVDGDTLHIDVNQEVVKVRLLGINTPELVDPRRPVECFGQEASHKAKELLSGQGVYVQTDPTQGMYDKYDRLLAYVFLEDGTNVNKLMIEEGYAFEYTYNLPYMYQKEFKLAEQQAQIQEKGLWAEGVCDY